MATGSITVTDQASGSEVASRTITEDALAKHIQRVQLDSRLNAPAKRYLISIGPLPGSTTSGANIAGLRKLAANADAYIHRIHVVQYNVAASTASTPINVKRASSVAGGTLVTAADVPKLDTAAANATLEVRTGAVTGTEAAQNLMSFGGVPTLAAGGGYGPDQFDSGGDLARAIRLTGDEGLVFEQAQAGDADLDWFIVVEWEEA